MNQTRLPLWLVGAALLAILGLLAFLLAGGERGQSRDSATGQGTASPTMGKESPQASVEFTELYASPDGGYRSVAQGPVPDFGATLVAAEEPGVTLKLNATWGGMAPISFQGFEISISSLEIEEAYQTTLAAYIEKGSAPIPEGIWRRMQRQGESMPYREIGTTDARGEYTFEGLPEGMLRIVPLGNGFDAVQDEREFMLHADCDFQYVADPGLAYGGRVLGDVKEGVHMRLHKLHENAGSGVMRSYVIDSDGGFLFRGLDSGTYLVELYDKSRWSALKRYPPFEIDRDVYDARIDAPRVGRLSLKVWDLPEGTELTGCYVKRVIDVQKDPFGGNWILNDESDADSCSFDALSYGEYQLFVRGMHNSDQGGRGQGEILARLNVTMESPEVGLEWAFAPIPTVWVRLVGEGRGDADVDDPNRGLPLESIAKIGKFVDASELGDLDGIQIRFAGSVSMPDWTYTIPAGQSFTIPFGNESYSDSKPPLGMLSVRSAEGVLQHQQGFWMIKGTGSTRYPIRMDLAQAPFQNRSPRMRDGCIELMLPMSLGLLQLKVDLVGYESRIIEFELLDGLTIDAVLNPLESSHPRTKEDPTFVITGDSLQLETKGD